VEASDAVDWLVARYPFTKLLDSSPAISTLRLISRQFPVLRVAAVTDTRPAMVPRHKDWRAWLEATRNDAVRD
jgi:nitrous oxidase accessory protein